MDFETVRAHVANDPSIGTLKNLFLKKEKK